jgi:hypothetical protein
MSQTPPPAPSVLADPGSTQTPPPARPAPTLPSAAQTPAAGSPLTPDRPAPTAPAAPAGFRVLPPTRSPQSGTGSPSALPAPLADPLGSGAISVPTGTPSSADQPAKLTLDKRAVKEICRGLVLMLTDAVHTTMARTEEEQQLEVWKSTEDEQRQIGDPLASIAVRHGNGLPGSPDLADLVKLGLGTLGYVARNAREAIQIRKTKRERAKLALTPDLPEHPAAGQ